MTTKQHTQKCLTHRFFRRAAWIREHPDHCVQCEGAGGYQAGSLAPDEPTEWIECDNCVNESRCARCCKDFEGNVYENQLPCTHCGWNWGRGNTDLIPLTSGCICNADGDITF